MEQFDDDNLSTPEKMLKYLDKTSINNNDGDNTANTNTTNIGEIRYGF